MCGIFGIVSSSPVSQESVHLLGESNTERGNLAFGALVITSQGYAVHRFTTPFDSYKVPLGEAKVILGHVRAPTGEQSDSLEVVHPFETNSIFVAHNGLILNYQQFPHWRINSNIDVDSQLIAGGVQFYLDADVNIETAICLTAETLDGQQACWLWDKASQKVYLWRVMSPIYIEISDTQVVFSSTKVNAVNSLLKEGILYCLDISSNKFLEVKSFNYYNPYKIRR
jgi:glucosamine 6-phosphate synthetase-like amidotransferase/phosphosugar isomerase protein